MKKIIILCLIQLLISCSKDAIEPIIPNEQIAGSYDEYIERYNINKTGLVLEGLFKSEDSKQIIFNGRINQKLWVGVYDTEFNKQLYEWTDEEKLDTLVNLYTGYGDYSDYKLEKFFLREYYLFNDKLCFILLGIGSAVSNQENRVLNSNLYFLNNNLLTSKHKSFALSTFGSFSYNGYYTEIKPWFNGIFTYYRKESEDPKETWLFFSFAGDSIYSFDNASNVINKSEPINMEEGVVYHSDKDWHQQTFSRLNFKSNKTIWISDKRPFEEIPKTAKNDSFTLTKGDMIWRYSTKFTTFDGVKIVKNFRLNIETGEINME